MQSPTLSNSISDLAENFSKSPHFRKPILTIFFQFNPWKTSLGGIQTIIRSFIKYAPDTFDIRLVGTGDDETQRD
jgi:hypothetical protein